MSKALKLRESDPHASDNCFETIDFMTLNKVNFRTKFKSESGCAVCAAPSYALHHIRPLKHKGGRFTGYTREGGFDKVVAALGRKQIPVCKQCHQNIHSGKYDGVSLDDLYDIRMVAPESLLKFSDSPGKPKPSESADSSDGPKNKEKKSPSFVIDEKARTYLSESLKQYLKNKKTL
jgi:hypothetical protein